ncbi:MAG TPA: hypothetical protein VGF79_03070 [Bacteroidia bacterium]
MKNRINLWIASFILAAVSFTACSKEDQAISNNSSNGIQASSLPEADVMTTQADEAFANSEVMGGTESEGFYFENNGLPEAYRLDESCITDLNSSKRDENTNGITKCLSKLELSDDQIVSLRKSFKAYEECKSSVINRYTLALDGLIKKYNAQHELLLKALRNGRITKQEFEAKVRALRVLLMREKQELASKARHAVKACYGSLLRSMHSILNERQWKAFVNCYR